MNAFYASGGVESGHIDTPSPWGANSPYYYPPAGNAGVAQVTSDLNPYLNLGDTIAVSPNTVVDVRIGVQRTHAVFETLVYKGFNYAAIGTPANIIPVLPIPGTAPQVAAVSPWSDLDFCYNCHKDAHQTKYVTAVGATKVKGNWTLKFGGEAMFDFSNTPNPYYTGGNFSPDGCAGCEYSDINYNGLPQNITPDLGGMQAAGMMLGAANDTFSAAQAPLPALAEKYMAFYTQNTWKATPKLTVNLGLRWEVQPGPTERFNRMTAWDANGNTTINGVTTPGEEWYVGVGGHSRNLWATQYTNFGPRLGVAYRWTDTMVVRGGYGISYIPSNTGLLAGPFAYGMFPWGLGATALPNGLTPNGGPIGPVEDAATAPLVLPVGPVTSAPQNYGVSPNLYPNNYVNGYAQQWNFFIEKRVGNWFFSVGYIGSHGNDLPVLRKPINGENNLLPANIISCYHNGMNCPASDSAVAAAGGYAATGVDPFGQNVPNPFNSTGLPFQGTYRSEAIPRGIVDGDFPLYSGQTVPGDDGYSSYNALQVEVKHQVARGLLLDSTYTWSKELDYSSFEAENNYEEDTNTNAYAGGNLLHVNANRKLGANDVPARLVTTLVYDLPFGAGHNLNPSNRVARFLASGWGFGAVELDESGYPQDINDPSSGSLDGRPNINPNEPFQVPKALQHWYNGKTSVTLPDGRVITPCAYCFLKYNPDIWVGQTIPESHQGWGLPERYLLDGVCCHRLRGHAVGRAPQPELHRAPQL